jgi:cytochrome c-type biogenesis protein CcmI
MIMIWVIFAAMALAAAVFLAKPLFATIPPEEDAELTSYFAQIDALNANELIDPDEAQDAIAGLKRQILDRRDGKSTRSSMAFNIALLCVVGLIGAGVYALQGRPDMASLNRDVAKLSPPVVESPLDTDEDRNAQLASLVEQLEDRLNNERADDPNGWLIYARSLMSLGRFDDAVTAYDRVVLLTDGRLAVVEERDRAVAYIAQRKNSLTIPPTLDARPQRGPTEQDVQDAQTMTANDRQAMIQGMVEGLALRLEDDPSDPAEWARLIRARQVLGQSDQAASDVARMRLVFADNPDVVSQIIESAGWVTDDQ